MNFSRKIDNLILLVRCLAYSLVHGRADRIPARISRIIIVPAGKLGDIVCTTPVFHAIRTRFPNAEIIAAGNADLLRSLLADSGLADTYLELDRKQSVAQIRERHADVALITGPSFEVSALLYLAGIPLVVAAKVDGYSPLETIPYAILRRLLRTFPYGASAYAPRERLRALEPLGIVCDDTAKRLGFSAEAEARAMRFLRENGISENDFVVGISPSAGNKIKEWPEERFAEVAEYLSSVHGAKTLIIGGPSDARKVRDTVARVKPEMGVVAATGFSIGELKALISKLGLFVAVDTGPIYIAEAFGVPTVDIVGPVDERVQPPRGPLHRNVIPPGRSRAHVSIVNAREYDAAESKRQVLSITVPLVLKEIDELIASRRKVL